MSEEKNYTIEDIEVLPKGQRVELFDGEMVMMASPTTTHQDIQMYLAAEIHSYIKYKGGNCKIFASPFAVFLKSDGRNYLEPDIPAIYRFEDMVKVGIFEDLEIDLSGIRDIRYE